MIFCEEMAFVRTMPLPSTRLHGVVNNSLALFCSVSEVFYATQTPQEHDTAAPLLPLRTSVRVTASNTDIYGIYPTTNIRYAFPESPVDRFSDPSCCSLAAPADHSVDVLHIAPALPNTNNNSVPPEHGPCLVQ